MSTILVIEDDDDIRHFLETSLSRAGHRVSGAVDGKAGVEAFRRNPADLVITDIIMPEKDGIETLMDLRRESPGVKVIVISGGGRIEPDNYLHSAKLLGAARTLSKPFSRQDLLEAVESLLD